MGLGNRVRVRPEKRVVTVCTSPYKAFFICYEYEEITPILKGTWRYKQTNSGTFEEVSELTKDEEIRSLIETQERI